MAAIRSLLVMSLLSATVPSAYSFSMGQMPLMKRASAFQHFSSAGSTLPQLAKLRRPLHANSKIIASIEIPST
jgi:hypothetical protein